jgi:GDPmannose 4,6-dehydratase
MTRILGHAVPEDFVVATGEPHTVGEFLRITCEIVGVDWRECAVTDDGILKKKPVRLIGDYGKLRRLTGWRPTTSFHGMIEKMLDRAQTTVA